MAEEPKERKAFEAWAASVGYHTERDMFQREKYQSTITWELWRVWQARAALSAPSHGEQVREVPSNCRQRLVAEGKAYPKSSCAVCGQFSPKWRECDAMLTAPSAGSQKEQG